MGYTPNYIALGREMQMPVDIVYGVHEDDEETICNGYISVIKERLLDAYADVRVSLKQAVRTQKKYYDMRASQTNKLP